MDGDYVEQRFQHNEQLQALNKFNLIRIINRLVDVIETDSELTLTDEELIEFIEKEKDNE